MSIGKINIYVCNKCGRINVSDLGKYISKLRCCACFGKLSYVSVGEARDYVTEPKYRSVFPEFIKILEKRMEQGFKEYGDKSFERAPKELLNEIEEEVVDICGWGLILYTKLQALQKKVEG